MAGTSSQMELLALIYQHLVQVGYKKAAKQLQLQSGQKIASSPTVSLLDIYTEWTKAPASAKKRKANSTPKDLQPKKLRVSDPASSSESSEEDERDGKVVSIVKPFQTNSIATAGNTKLEKGSGKEKSVVEDLRKRARYLRRDDRAFLRTVQVQMDREAAERAGAQSPDRAGAGEGPSTQGQEEEQEEELHHTPEGQDEEQEVVVEQAEEVKAAHLPHTSSSPPTEGAEASPEAAAAGVESVAPGPALPAAASGDQSLWEELRRLREQMGSWMQQMDQRVHALEGGLESVQHILGLIHSALEHV